MSENEFGAIHDWIRETCLQNDTAKELTAETNLLDEGTLDSLQIVQMVSFLEEQYGVVVDMEELVPENFETIGKIGAMVVRLRQAESA